MHRWTRERARWEEWKGERLRVSRSVGDGAGGAQAPVSRGTVQITKDAVVYPAQEEGRGQREDAPGMEHPVRWSGKNRWNRWHMPRASQGRAGEERGPETEGKQLQTPGKQKWAERHAGGLANAMAAG